MKGPDQVLATRGVDRRLAADRGIDLRQKGRWNLHHVDAAHVERRRQTGQITDHAAAEGDDQVAPVQTEVQQAVDHPLKFSERLRTLAGRNGQQPGADAGGLKRGQRRWTMQQRHGLICDDHRATPNQRGHTRPQFCHQAAADDDVIRLEAGTGDLQGGGHVGVSAPKA